MIRSLTGIGTLGLVLGLTSIAGGQDRQQPKEPPVLGPVLSRPDVQSELKLSEEQISKLKEALGKVTEKYKDDLAKFARMSFEERVKKMMEISRESNKAMGNVMDAKQIKRYRQIEWQMAGIGALGDPELQKELKLGDEQKKKINNIAIEFEKKLYEMSTNSEASQEKYVALIKDFQKKTSEVLTEEQHKSFKELMGPPFQFLRPGPP
jgi:hypothetical protein